MKFITFVFCAAVLTASSSFGMKTPAAPATKAPQSSWIWKKHLASGIGKLACGLPLPIWVMADSYKKAFQRKQLQPLSLFLGSLATIAGVGHTSFQSLKKAYSAYRGDMLSTVKSPKRNFTSQLATSLGKLTAAALPAWVIYYLCTVERDERECNKDAAWDRPLFMSALAAAAVLAPPAYRSVKETYELHKEEKQANKATNEKSLKESR